LGERVFAIAASPADGDVWMATDAGLARYRSDDGAWSYYTRAEGLPADDIQCLAFDKKGALYAGTQCDGLAISAPVHVAGRLEYKVWHLAAAPVALQGRAPASPCGEGLPTNLINDVLVARDGAVYAATIAGLAMSRDGGRTWRFLRGQDWEDRARGLYQTPPDASLKAAGSLARGRTLLLEDYVTCLAEDDAGNLWVGHREKGYEVLDRNTGARLAAANSGVRQGGAPGKARPGRNRGPWTTPRACCSSAANSYAQPTVRA
jgi:ligand-binding sensor domain-containing protein